MKTIHFAQKVLKAFMGYPRLTALAAGILFTSGFAPFFLWPLAILSISYLFFLIRSSSSWRQALWAGFFFAMGHHLSGLYWLPRSFYVDIEGSFSFALLAGIPALFLLATYLSFYIAFVSALSFIVTRKNILWGALAFSCMWVGAEFLRSFLFTGFPWNLSGYIFADTLPLLQLAAVGGIWLLGLLAIITGSLLASGKKPAGISIFLVITAFIWGNWHLKQNKVETGQEKLLVRLVQPNIQQQDKWDRQKYYQNFTKLLQLTSQPGENNKLPDIIIWPETAAAAYFIEENHIIRAHIAEKLHPGQILITGSMRKSPEPELKIYNSILAIDHKGEVISHYDKKLLVPFGEYVPLRTFMPAFIQKMVHGRLDYSHGHTKVTLQTPQANFLPLVCYEAIFPSFVSKHIKNTDFIVNITNDGWFDGTTAPAQHHAMAKIRAVESGKYLLRAANTGISSFISPTGKETSRLNARQFGVLDIYLPSIKKQK